MAERRPSCIVLGGPNGAGKSSIQQALLPAGTFVNADAAARLLAPDNPEAVSLAAGRRVIRQLDALIEAGEDFVVGARHADKAGRAAARKQAVDHVVRRRTGERAQIDGHRLVESVRHPAVAAGDGGDGLAEPWRPFAEL